MLVSLILCILIFVNIVTGWYFFGLVALALSVAVLLDDIGRFAKKLKASPPAGRG